MGGWTLNSFTVCTALYCAATVLSCLFLITPPCLRILYFNKTLSSAIPGYWVRCDCWRRWDNPTTCTTQCIYVCSDWLLPAGRGSALVCQAALACRLLTDCRGLVRGSGQLPVQPPPDPPNTVGAWGRSAWWPARAAPGRSWLGGTRSLTPPSPSSINNYLTKCW